MANAALAHINLFDTATLTASSEAASTPVTNLQNVHIANKWRGTAGTAEWILATFAADVSADTFKLRGLGSTFLTTGTARLRLSTLGGGATSGDVYDSTVEAGKVDPNYGYLIHLLTSKTFRYARWDLVQAGASYIEAGRGAITNRTEFTYNPSPGAQRGWITNTKKVKSRGGQTFVDRSTGQVRFEDFSLGWIDEAQRWALHEALDIANADHTDVLFIKDTASLNLGRDSIWGLVDQVSPVLQPFDGNTGLFARSIRIEERG